ncbi:class I SAM-dependent methyltransferase [candidate division WWE3 bacterium]|nr:class I SAM-dependent methyltransferase [candidate division WWE3 bacterium]
MMRKAQNIDNRINSYIKGKTILDVGVGAGSISCFYTKKGYSVMGIDVADLSIYADIKATWYDGNHIELADQSIDTAIIIHVLHHCQNPLDVLTEAKRVAKRVIFIEDTYRNKLEHLAVSINDNITNWEFYQHPYRTVEEWKTVCSENKWNIIHTNTWSEWFHSSLYSRYCMFVIE